MQAPQFDVSQPTCVPVRPSWSRRAVDEQEPRLDVQLVRDAVDGHAHGDPLGHASPLPGNGVRARYARVAGGTRPCARRHYCFRSDAHLQRDPADRTQAPGQLHRRDHASTSPARTGATRRSTASSTCTRSPSATTPPSCASASTTRPRSSSPPAWIPSAASSSARATCRSTPSSCWLLSSVTELGRAEPHAPVPRQVGRPARAGLRRPAHVPGAAGRRRARLPRRRGAGGRGPARAPRAHARRRRALQHPLRRDARRPEHRIPEVGARITRPPGARAQDVDDRRLARRGRSTSSTSRAPSRRSSSARSPTPRTRRRSAAATTSRGSRTSSRSSPRSAASTPEAVEAEFADARGYGDFKVAVGEAVVDWLAPVRERYEELRADEAGVGADSRRRGRQGAGDRVRTRSRTSARSWASARRGDSA